MPKIRVAAIGDVQEGHIKQVTAGELEIILVRVEGRVRAFSARCPHHDAPLADGLLDGDRLLCPWHQSVFRVTDGELLEPPALAGLACFEVDIDGDDVLVDVPEQGAAPGEQTVSRRDGSADERTVVIVGGGAAGLAAAQELRGSGFGGRLVMISDDARPPYDRTQCSKLYLAGEAPQEWMPLKPQSFYADAEIELVEHRVDAIDVKKRRIALPGGAVIEADGLLLATGGRPIRPPLDGVDLEGVMTLRTWDDSDRIAELADEARRVVVIGASFIGMEVAASLVQRGVKRPTVIAPEEIPFESVLGPQIGALLRDIHRQHGVGLRLGQKVGALEGDGRVRAVVLADGSRIEADLVVMGTGVRPATDFIQGVELEHDGSLRVDERLRVREDVYAAGDIATFRDWRTGEWTRIEHWRTAQQQGMIAGRNLAGQTQPYRAVPFFWTEQFDAVLGYVGHASSWDEVIVHGRVPDCDFVSYYVRDDKLLAAAAMGRDRQLNALHELMLLEREPSPGLLRAREIDLVDSLRETPLSD